MGNKIVDYFMLVEDDSYQVNYGSGKTLSEKVVEYIKKGWQPFGDPFLYMGRIFAQVVVRYQPLDMV